MNKTVTDYNKPNYVNDTSKPIAWQQVFQGYQQIFDGYEQVHVGYGTKVVDDPRTRMDDKFENVTVAQTVKANPGQLLLNANSVQTVKGVWKSATVAAKGTGTNQTVGSRVNFTTAKLVTLNGTQYLVVDARAAR
jgi:uncharacterized protein (DUF2147 family)